MQGNILGKRRTSRRHVTFMECILTLTYHLMAMTPSKLYSSSFLPAVEANTAENAVNAYKYNICNGLSNQLLYHASSLALAIENEKEVVLVPDHYITNGAQKSNDNVYPTSDNSIPFRIVFDQQNFRSSIQEISHTYLSAKYEHNHTNTTIRPIQIAMVTFKNDEESRSISCAGMATVQKANPQILLKILQQSFQPSRPFQSIIDKIHSKIMTDTGNKETLTTSLTGICIHHRDGVDWHEHCSRWGSIKDGIYRGNCLGIPNETFFESIQNRGIAPAYHTSTTRNWIYYCGDHEPPIELTNITFPHRTALQKDLMQDFHINPTVDKVSVYKRQNDVLDYFLLDTNFLSSVTKVVTPSHPGVKEEDQENDIQVLQRVLYEASKQQHHRDIFALIDFFVCSKIPYFVGNSVSTFSAIQVAIRNNYRSYWYNSRSIPLADVWPTYPIPIVYTYTETSQQSGRILLQASIVSVRKHMPTNPIHILYHGNEDIQFIRWLRSMTIRIHHHTNIVWKDAIEIMRQNGNVSKSNLYLHSGNYFGTWQRIDIPLYIESEYCLLLDADTIIRKPFTMSDFGLELTSSIALSAEFDRMHSAPMNAGVMLMNIPYLRKTYSKFLSYILEHVNNTKFDHPSPSDQGAYLSFYKDTALFLPTRFNFKPYWTTSDLDYSNSFIIHFHGAKPSDYIRYGVMMMELYQAEVEQKQNESIYSYKFQQYTFHNLKRHNKTKLKHIPTAKPRPKPKCDSAIQFLCEQVPNVYFICPSLQEFLGSANYIEYCNSVMRNNTEHINMCISFVQSMIDDDSPNAVGRSSVTNNRGCQYFDSVIFGPGNARRKRKRLDEIMLRVRPDHLVQHDIKRLQAKVAAQKRRASMFNYIFRGIKNYRLRRITRISVSYMMYALFLALLYLLLNFVKRLLPTKILVFMQQVQLKAATTVSQAIRYFFPKDNQQYQNHSKNSCCVNHEISSIKNRNNNDLSKDDDNRANRDNTTSSKFTKLLRRNAHA